MGALITAVMMMAMWQQGGSGTLTMSQQATCMATFCVQPVDVPAIEESRTEEYGNTNWCNSCSGDAFGGSCTAMACDPHAKHTVSVTTCADKSRILEHDENDPPKYWCRKVQP